MAQRHYAKGEVILSQGEAGDHVCRLISGQAEVVRGAGKDAIVLGIVGPGQFIGEMAVVENRRRSATVRAADSVTVETIARDDFFRMVSEDKDLAYSLIVRLSERLRHADDRLAEPAVAAIPESGRAQPAVQITGELPRMRLFAGEERVSREIPEDGLAIDRLPFVVGRRPGPHEDTPDAPVDLALLDMKPYRLSRLHFAVERSGVSLVLRDMGSHLGTQLNGVLLGEAFTRDRDALQMGDNVIVAGGIGSGFTFTLRLEEPAG